MATKQDADIAMLMLENLIRTDELGRVTNDLPSVFFKQMHEQAQAVCITDLLSFKETVRRMHCDYLIDFEDHENLDEAIIRLRPEGIAYYLSKKPKYFT